MKILMVIFCLLPALCCSGKITVTGREGQSVTVWCSHSWALKNKKYFCKNQCSSDDDVLIKSEGGQSNKKNGRFSLFDEGTGTFRVTITGLKKTDTGTYWCGVNRYIKDTYTEVYLSVLDAPCSTAVPPETTTSSQVGGQTTGTLVYTTAGASVALLLCGLTVAGVRKRRRNKTLQSTSVFSNSGGANMDHAGIPGQVENVYEVQINFPGPEHAVSHRDGQSSGEMAISDPKGLQNDSVYQSLTFSSDQEQNVYHVFSLAK